MKLHLPLFLSSVPLSFGWHQGVGHHGHKQHDQSLRTPKLRWLFKLCNQRKQKFSRGTKQHHKACVFSLYTSPLGHEGWGCLKNPAFLTQHTNQEAINTLPRDGRIFCNLHPQISLPEFKMADFSPPWNRLLTKSVMLEFFLQCV